MMRRLWRWIATMVQVESFATGYALGLAKGQDQGLRIAGDLEQHAEMSMRLNFDLLQERDALSRLTAVEEDYRYLRAQLQKVLDDDEDSDDETLVYLVAELRRVRMGE